MLGRRLERQQPGSAGVLVSLVERLEVGAARLDVGRRQGEHQVRTGEAGGRSSDGLPLDRPAWLGESVHHRLDQLGQVGGTAADAPDSAPEAASVNSRTRLSTWALADSSRSVGTSPSLHGHAVRLAGFVVPGGEQGVDVEVRGLGLARDRGGGQLAPHHLAGSATPSTPQLVASASTSAMPRPVIASVLAIARIGALRIGSRTSTRTTASPASLLTTTRREAGVPACSRALVTSSDTTSSTSPVSGSARLPWQGRRGVPPGAWDIVGTAVEHQLVVSDAHSAALVDQVVPGMRESG